MILLAVTAKSFRILPYRPDVGQKDRCATAYMVSREMNQLNRLNLWLPVREIRFDRETHLILWSFCVRIGQDFNVQVHLRVE